MPGILGGMGPQASCELYRLINDKSVNHYRAVRNADFPHMLISNLPVPDLINSQDDQDKTVAMLAHEAGRLQNAGVTDLFMACNTMHLYQAQMFGDLSCRFHSLIDIVVRDLVSRAPDTVLLLGTQTTIRTSLYQDAMTRAGIGYTQPSEALLTQSVDMILDAISGQVDRDKKDNLRQAIQDEAMTKGADMVLLACTELPLIISGNISDALPAVNSLDLLASRICDLHYKDIGMAA